MSKLRFAVLVALVMVPAALCLPTFVAPSRPSPPSPQPTAPSDLPAGAMQETARNACTTCHDAGIIVQQRLSKDAWGKEVDKMVRWGSQVEAKDHDALIDYLSANFPPDKLPDPPTRVAPRK